MADVNLGRVSVLAETNRAILVRLEDQDDAEVWIPKSCIGEDSTVEAKGDEGDLYVAEWFAEKEGLEPA